MIIETKVNRRPYIFYDFEKIEKYLEEEHSNGWALDSYSWKGYKFNNSKPSSFSYKLEYNINPKLKEEIIKINKQSNWEFICDFESWIYFRKENIDTDLNKIKRNLEETKNIYSRLILGERNNIFIALSGIILIFTAMILGNVGCILNYLCYVLIALFITYGVFSIWRIIRLNKLIKEKT